MARAVPRQRCVDDIRSLARPRRENEQLALWDELDAQELLPPSLRAWLPVPEMGRETLKELWVELVAALGEVKSDAIGS